MKIIRKEHDVLLSRLNEPRSVIQVIVGPRQIGKTTMVEQVMEKVGVPYSFLTADNYAPQSGWIAQIWQRERMTMSVLGETERVLVIDEIQKIPNWSEQVKKEWDADTRNAVNIKVVLLGSSRMMIMSGLTESLAGRFELIRMSHWSFTEMKEAFDWNLQTYIYFGGYPGAANYISNELRWRQYVRDAIAEPSVTKDVLETSRVYKPALLKQLFELGCSYSGEILSYTKILGQLQDAGNVTTLTAYMELLQQGNLVAGLQKFAVDSARKRNSVPKFQVFNNALLNTCRRNSFSAIISDPLLWGHQVESAVGAYLLNESEKEDMQVYYWRDKDSEVDFVLQRGLDIVGIEVKSNGEPWTKGLDDFDRRYNPHRVIVVGEAGLNLEVFLGMNLNALFE